MKKLMLCGLGALLICSCANLDKYSTVDDNASAQVKMKACLISDANSRFQAGTLFSKGIKATANEMVTTCTKKLALQSAGISSEAQSTAQTIIKNFQNYNTATN